MADRYKMAMGIGKQAYAEAVEEDQTLLEGFGLGLLSVDNGVRVVVKKLIRSERINPWDVIQVNAKLWGWLRPLLAELADRRRQEAVKPIRAMKKKGRRVPCTCGKETHLTTPTSLDL